MTLCFAQLAERTGARAGIVAIAPHPDDESLGCGGLIALARAADVPVIVAYVTDGEASHPGSQEWPPTRLAVRRRQEGRRACHVLGVRRPPVWLGLPDAGASSVTPTVWTKAVETLQALLVETRPGLVVTTWEREPHSDHQAAHSLAVQAMRASGSLATLARYTVWTERIGTSADRPRPDEATPLTLRLGPAMATKRRALDAHQSQLGRVVRDDPGGFVLSPTDREAMLTPCETYWT